MLTWEGRLRSRPKRAETREDRDGPERRMAERGSPQRRLRPSSPRRSRISARNSRRFRSIERLSKNIETPLIVCVRLRCRWKALARAERPAAGRPSSVAEHRFQECLIHSSEDLLHQSRRILSEMPRFWEGRRSPGAIPRHPPFGHPFPGGARGENGRAVPGSWAPAIRRRPYGESLPRAMSPVKRDMVRVHTNHISLQERVGVRGRRQRVPNNVSGSLVIRE